MIDTPRAGILMSWSSSMRTLRTPSNAERKYSD